MSHPKDNLASAGLTLPQPPSAVAVYRSGLIVGDLCYTSGHLPFDHDGEIIKGILGQNVDVDNGYQAAQMVGLNMLATLESTLGDLSRVVQVVKLLGMVASTSEFTQHPSVINGCSELMKTVFGDEIGVGTRSAVGVASLPLGACVEIEGIFQIKI